MTTKYIPRHSWLYSKRADQRIIDERPFYTGRRNLDDLVHRLGARVFDVEAFKDLLHDVTVGARNFGRGLR